MNTRQDPHYQAYHSQKARAKKRNIDWHFTLQSWTEWWGDDFYKRGRSKDSLCMARNGDVGAYHQDNVFKSTFSDNAKTVNRDYVTDINKTYKSKPVQTPDGSFPSIHAAANHYGHSDFWIYARLIKYPTQFYRI